MAVGTGLQPVARAIASTFLFLAGFSLVLAHYPQLRPSAFFRRLGIVALAAAAIIVVPWLTLRKLQQDNEHAMAWVNHTQAVGVALQQLQNRMLTQMNMDHRMEAGRNQEAHRTYPMGLPSPQDEAVGLHRYCYERGISAGFIHPEDDLSKLKLLYVPHWLIWKDEWTEKLRAFAEAGGTVVLSARTGSRRATMWTCSWNGYRATQTGPRSRT